MSINSNRIISLGKKLAQDNTGDLQLAFNSTQKSHAWYFSTAVIKMGAKNKPFNNTTVVFASTSDRDTARAGANYGLTIPSCTTSQLLGSDWTLHRPNGTGYPRRALDFNGYYIDAPDVPVCCMNTGNLVVNIININAVFNIVFFVYQKSGYLADKAPDATEGCSVASVGRNSTQIAACLDLSELNASGGSVITSLTTPYLGIAIYDGTTFKKFVGCPSQLVAEQTSQRDIDMYQMSSSRIRTEGIALALGDYTAVACIQYGSGNNIKYIPLPTGTGNIYQNTFNLTLGGANLYSYMMRGVAATNVVSSNTTLTTNGDTIYITVRVQNNTNIAHASNTTNSNWYLKTRIRGSMKPRADLDPVQIDRVATSSMANFYPGTLTNLTIPANGTTDITFAVSKIWNADPDEPAVQVYSGNVALTGTLVFIYGGEEQEFTSGGVQPALLVTYGS